MDLNLSDEQRLLRESVDRFINETYDSDHRRRTAGDKQNARRRQSHDDNPADPFSGPPPEDGNVTQ